MITKKSYFFESNYFSDYLSTELEVEKIISNLEKKLMNI